jgi:hypothetical protein
MIYIPDILPTHAFIAPCHNYIRRALLGPIVAFGYNYDVFDHNDATGCENRLSGPESIFKIIRLESARVGLGPPEKDSSKVSLFRVLDDSMTKTKTIHDVYDFGNGWEHIITNTRRTDLTAHCGLGAILNTTRFELPNCLN